MPTTPTTILQCPICPVLTNGSVQCSVNHTEPSEDNSLKCRVLFLPLVVGEDGTPSIRPLETLHNALSLRQVDSFLEQITNNNYRTPTVSPSVENLPDSTFTDSMELGV